MKHYQKYKVASVMSESLEAYTSMVLAVVWIFLMFYIKSKQQITFIYYLWHIFREMNGIYFDSRCLWPFSLI